MATRTVYVWREGLGVIPKDQAEPLNASAYLIRDQMDPIVHHATGQLVDSKSRFRAMTKAAGCIEVGNEVQKPRQRPREDLTKDVAKAVRMVREGYRPSLISRSEWGD